MGAGGIWTRGWAGGEEAALAEDRPGLQQSLSTPCPQSGAPLCKAAAASYLHLGLACKETGHSVAHLSCVLERRAGV